MDVNKRSFKLVNRISKTFQFAIANFEFATTLIFRIIQQIDTDFTMSLISKISTTISQRRIRIIISTVKLITNLTQILNSKYIKITYSMKQIMKFITVIDIEIPIAFVSKARQKLVTVMGQGKIHITATAVYAIFNLLGTFDPDTLGTLDTEILGDMDYTLV